MLYRGVSDYRTVTGFVEEAVAARQPVMVALPAPRLDFVRQSLPSTAGVLFVDMAELGRNPNRIIPAVSEFAQEQSGGGMCRYVGEPHWPGRTAPERDEIARHDALFGQALGECPIMMLCAYDLDTVPTDLVSNAWRTHPEVIVNGALRESPFATAPFETRPDEAWPLAGPPPESIVRDFAFDDLSTLRRIVGDKVTAAGFRPERVDDMVLAVNEVASNSLVHGGGSGTLSLWREGPDGMVAEVCDAGHIPDPLVGRHPPGPHLEARGLWLVNQICDLVQVRSGPGGTTIRMTLYR